MPRGIGRHFCTLNLADAFSSSFVDIYDLPGTVSNEIKLNLWLFLNSSVGWLLREINGRKNLGGGMLKAEAVDLRDLPIYFDFRQHERIMAVMKRLDKRSSLETVEEINTAEHREIDQIVFDHLHTAETARHEIVKILCSRIIERHEKSRT